MITDDILTPIGKIGKPHGINGELNLLLDDDFAFNGPEIDTLRCIVIDIDGINVPFFIDSWRAKSDVNLLIKIDGIDSDNEARRLGGKTAMALKEDYDPADGNGEDGLYAADLIGYTLIDDGTPLGTIEDIEDSTDNALFIISRPDSDKPLYVPIALQLITEIDQQNKTITMSLPQGLVDL